MFGGPPENARTSFAVRQLWLLPLLIACAPPAKPPPPVAEEPFVLDSREDPKHPLGSLSAGSGAHQSAAFSYLPGHTRAPGIHGTVHGKPTWMLLDTGASTHFIEDWMLHRIFADDVNETATDHIGRVVKTSRLDEPKIALDGWGKTPETTAMIMNDTSESSDLGVTLSPQKLASSGSAVVLDFPNKTITLARSRDAAERALPRGAALAPAQKCGGVYFVNAKVGDTEARLLVDTGAWASDLKPQSAAAHALVMHTVNGQAKGYGAGGVINSHRLPGITVTVGAVRQELELQLLEQAADRGACRSDGVVGMDLLQNCVLVIDEAAITGKCVVGNSF